MIELLKERTILRASGAGALAFLQGLVTNDLIKNDYCFNYLLSSQGRYLYDFFVAKISDQELLIDIAAASAERFLKRLNLYKLRSKVELEDLTGEYCVLYAQDQPEIDEDIIIAAQDPRFAKMGLRLIARPKYINTIQPVVDKLYMMDKYEHAIPDGNNDLIYELSMISWFGAEQLSAVSFTKGCYIGQEVVARAKYQGSVRKKLFKLVSDQEIGDYKAGTEITNAQGDKLGIFCSGYNRLGLALLNEEKYFALGEKTAIINGQGQTSAVKIAIPEWRASEQDWRNCLTSS